jgi:hypothetical protein
MKGAADCDGAVTSSSSTPPQAAGQPHAADGPGVGSRLAAIRQMLAAIATVPAHAAHVRPCHVHGGKSRPCGQRPGVATWAT